MSKEKVLGITNKNKFGKHAKIVSYMPTETKKMLFVFLCAVLLFGGTILGCFAYIIWFN